MALTKILRQADGSSTLEAAISLPVIFLTFVVVFAGLYGVFLQSALHHQTYEFLLCSEFSSPSTCELSLRHRLSSVVPFGHWRLKTFPPSDVRKVQVDFSLPIYGNHIWTWNYQNQMKRDLSLSSF